MARIRSIHPGIYTDESWASVSIPARWLAKGICTESDDNGIFDWKPLQLKMRIFPADNVDVAELMAELLEANILTKFDVAGKHFGAVKNFKKYQKPRKPKAWHPFPESVWNFVGDEPVPQKSEPEPVKETPVPQKSEKSPQREEGGGKRDDGDKTSCATGVALKPEHIVEEWNKTATRLGKPNVRDITPERRQLLNARINQYSLDDFSTVFGKVETSPFLRGERNWKGATFDWIFKKANFQKTLEGNYDE